MDTRCQLAAGLAILATWSALGQVRQATPPLIPVEWTPKLDLDSLAQVDVRLKRTFADSVAVTRKSQRALITDCASGLNFVRSGFAAESDRDLRRLKSLIADCRALTLLRSAKPSRRSALNGVPLEPRFLPATLGFLASDEMVSRAKAAQSKGLSWQDFEPDLKVEGNNGAEATIADGTGYARLQFYARGDFDGDGMEDLLLRDDTYPKQGTYANTRLFLLTRFTTNQILRILREYD